MRLGIVFFVASLISLHSIHCEAQSLVDGSSLRSTSVAVTVKGKRSTHSIFCFGIIPGTAAKRAASYKFTPYKVVVRDLKKKDPKSPKLPLLNALAAAGKSACGSPSSAPPQSTTAPLTPTPTATPVTSNPQPTRTPTPLPTTAPTSTPASGNFDRLGNVTDKGKSTFAIPNNLSANVTAGKSVFLSYCTGCHVERVGLSYPVIDASIRKSPMLYDESAISRQQLADLVAYLNRFRP